MPAWKPILPGATTMTASLFHNAFYDMTDTLGTATVLSGGFARNLSQRSNGQGIGFEFFLHRNLTEKLGGFLSYTLSRCPTRTTAARPSRARSIGRTSPTPRWPTIWAETGAQERDSYSTPVSPKHFRSAGSSRRCPKVTRHVTRPSSALDLRLESAGRWGQGAGSPWCSRC